MRRFGSWVRPVTAVLGAMVVNVALAGAAFAAPIGPAVGFGPAVGHGQRPGLSPPPGYSPPPGSWDWIPVILLLAFAVAGVMLVARMLRRRPTAQPQ